MCESSQGTFRTPKGNVLCVVRSLGVDVCSWVTGVDVCSWVTGCGCV